ncbi:MAG: multidrug transporter [Verrucomicrobia bacterium 12-59-8]|nr:MAG: multidrug transporter [Verrucomicrobia bacterium 12-59-8]
MHAGRRYSLFEFLLWTRRSIYWLLVIGCVPVVLYQIAGWKWMAIPWTVVALLGTATAFIVGFKNTQTYNRTWEARQIWGGILNHSRAWAVMSRDFLRGRPQEARALVSRHIAWLTALRYQMRDGRVWENLHLAHNSEYRRQYRVPELDTPLQDELARHLVADELLSILATKNRAAQIMSLQSAALAKLAAEGALEPLYHLEMQRAVRDHFDHQGRSERIKNFPYPRQFATINTFFIRLFCFLLPFGMLREFDALNDRVAGLMHGHMVWLVIPFSLLLSWVYVSLEQVGESTENPFEGGANDVPISQMSRAIEIDMLEMLGDTKLPPAIQPQNNILL